MLCNFLSLDDKTAYFKVPGRCLCARWILWASMVALAVTAILSLCACSSQEGSDNQGEAETVNSVIVSVDRENDSKSGTGDMDLDGQSAFDGQTNVAVGKTYSGEGFEMTVVGTEIVDSIEPENPDGTFYTVIEQQDGYKYFVVNTMVRMTEKDHGVGTSGWYTSLSDGASAFVHIKGSNGGNYAGDYIGIELDGSDIGTVTIPVGEQRQIKVVYAIPEEDVARLSGSHAYWTVDFYYQSHATLGMSSNVNEDGLIDAEDGGRYMYCLAL